MTDRSKGEKNLFKKKLCGKIAKKDYIMKTLSGNQRPMYEVRREINSQENVIIFSIAFILPKNKSIRLTLKKLIYFFPFFLFCRRD